MNENKVEIKNNAIIHKDNSLNRLDLSFLKHIELSEYKKSDLLAYWINDFAEYHDEERTFNIAKSGMYSRGDVIKVNLGFNIGNELGGLHYCIVLNKYDNLENIARTLFSDYKILFKWNTEDTISLDKIPYIGQYSKMWDNAYVATGFNKWGITTSNIAAEIITNKILGEESDYEEIFKSTRLEPIKNIKEVTNIVKESVNSLVIKKLEIPQEEANQIQNDEGKIVEVNGQKIGIYKDKEGVVYKVNPVCKHLGCELSWNNLEKTWDCPCHGSRFDHNGKNLYGPAFKDLKKFEL